MLVLLCESNITARVFQLYEYWWSALDEVVSFPSHIVLVVEKAWKTSHTCVAGSVLDWERETAKSSYRQECTFPVTLAQHKSGILHQSGGRLRIMRSVHPWHLDNSVLQSSKYGNFLSHRYEKLWWSSWSLINSHEGFFLFQREALAKRWSVHQKQK